MNQELGAQIGVGWDEEDGDARGDLRRLLMEVADPESWAVLPDGPTLLLLFEGGRRLMVATAQDREKIAVHLLHLPPATVVCSASGDREGRRFQGGTLRHWRFEPSEGETLSVDGWTGDDGRADQREAFARALAAELGWPFEGGG